MNHTKTTARAWAKYYKDHSLRATGAHFGVSHQTISTVLTHYGFPLRERTAASPARAAQLASARAAKFRALADAAEG